jgi:hypothetical protein
VAKDEERSMPTSTDQLFAMESVRRQGLRIPGDRQAALAAAAAKLLAASRTLEERLHFQADPYGFLTFLRQEEPGR